MLVSFGLAIRALTFLAAGAVGAGALASAPSSNVSLSDPAYTLIPLDEGNYSRLGAATYGGDGSGAMVYYP
ncbi:MAG: hypothetical protein ACRDQZ_16810, partial [Mycobacteriales bacterium]